MLELLEEEDLSNKAYSYHMMSMRITLASHTLLQYHCNTSPPPHCIGLAGHEDIFVKWVLSMLDSRFWCLSAGFWHGKLIGTIFRHLRLTQVAKMAIYGHSNVHKMAEFVTLVLRMLET